MVMTARATRSSGDATRRLPRVNPLAGIALGILVVALRAVTPGGYDLFPDPLGWVLVLVATVRLPIARRAPLLAAAALALAVAAPLWLPSYADRVADADPALRWTLELPQLAYVVLLTRAVAGLATTAEDTPARRWWTGASLLALVVALLPVLVDGGGQQDLAPWAELLAELLLLLVVVLGLRHARRPWIEPGSRDGS